ncbi:MAG: biotin/lipoyl-binding protein [Mucispirillum sp.]|nr:biotin/lipoyl-binding protein [Mucispirillum sp.]
MKYSNIAATKYYAIPEGYEQESTVHIKHIGPGVFVVNVDGRDIEVDFQRTGHNLYSIIIDNKSYEIDIHNDKDSYDVLVNGDYYKIDILDELKKIMRDRVSKSLQGRQVIATPMPGIVTQVMVEEGQEVEEGQPLLILVAMKMENQIKAPKAGIVQNLYVEANQTVAIGDKLAVVE